MNNLFSLYERAAPRLPVPLWLAKGLTALWRAFARPRLATMCHPPRCNNRTDSEMLDKVLSRGAAMIGMVRAKSPGLLALGSTKKSATRAGGAMEPLHPSR